MFTDQRKLAFTKISMSSVKEVCSVIELRGEDINDMDVTGVINRASNCRLNSATTRHIFFTVSILLMDKE